MGQKAKQRKAMTQQRKAAKRSVKQAQKLQSIYGNMTPEQVAAINNVAPDLGGAQGQLAAAAPDQPQAYTAQPDDGGYDDGGDYLENLEYLDHPLAIMAAYNKHFGNGSGNGKNYTTQADHFENMENAEEGGLGLDDIADSTMNIVDMFRKNWEANKPEGYEGYETYENVENFLGLEKFFKSFRKKHNEDNMESAENFESGDLMKKFFDFALFGVVGYVLIKHVGGVGKYIGYGVIAFGAYNAFIKKHEEHPDDHKSKKKHR